MTGAGSATQLAFGIEQSFLGNVVTDVDGNPEYWGFGRNPNITELDLQRQLARMRDGLSAEAVESIAGKIDGAVGIEAAVSADTHSAIHDAVFNDNGTGIVTGRPPFSRIFTGVNHLDGSVDRELQGCIPLEYSLSFDEDTETVNYSLSLGYATEPDNPSSLNMSNVTGPTLDSTAAFHGFTLTIDGTSVAKLSTAELTVSNIARYHFGPNAEPVDATIANPEVELSTDATFTSGSDDRLSLTYGSTTASSPQDRMDSVTGEVDVAGPSGSIATYTLPQLKPDSTSWENVLDTEDTQDSTVFHVNGGIGVA